MKITGSLLVKRLLTFIVFISLFFLFSFKTDANAQDFVTGLGYVDTKTFNRLPASYYPFRTAFDSNNNMFIVGEMTEDYDSVYVDPTIDLDWNSGVSNYQGTFFLAKYSPQREFLWGITYGNYNSSVGAGGIAIDTNNNIYISGDFTGTFDFDFTAGTDNKTSASAQDAFITKINANGTYAWTKTWGGNQYDNAYNIAVDTARNALYVTGALYVYDANPIDIDPGAGVDNKTTKGLLISKFDLDGNYLWGNTYGDLGGLSNKSIEIKYSTGDIYVGTRMWAKTIDFDHTAGVDNIVGTATSSIVIKLTSSNGYLGTILMVGHEIRNIVFDNNENFYLTGTFSGTVDFNPSGVTNSLTSAGSRDVYLTKWNASVNPYVVDVPYAWSQKFGGSSSDAVYALNRDSFNNIYIGGTFRNQNVDFNFSAGTDIHSVTTGQIWSFLTVINNDGSYLKTYSWGRTKTTKYGYIDIMDIGIDKQNRINAIGTYYEDTDFDPSTETYNLFGSDGSDYNYDMYVSIFYPYISSDPGDPIGEFGIPGETYSNNSTLSDLTTSEGNVSPSFASNTFTYNKDVLGSVGGISLTATSTSSTSRIAINGYAIKSGIESNLLSLHSGANPIVTTVWSEDNSSISTYTVTVNKPLPDGSYYKYDSAKQIGDPGSSISSDEIKIDSQGNFYVYGAFRNGPVDFGVSSVNPAMTQGIYILKLNSSQTPQWVLQWTNDFNNGLPYVQINDMIVDGDDNLYIVGGYQGTVDLDPTANTNSKASGGTLDAFMIKVNSDGTIAFIYTWGSTLPDDITSIDIDASGNLYVGGIYMATIDFDPSAGVNSVTNTYSKIHAYVSKFSSAGNYLWTRTYDTTPTSSTYASVNYAHLKIDSQNNIYSLGNFDGTNIDFNPSAGTDIISDPYGNSVYLTKLDSDGNYQWTKTFTSEDDVDVDYGDMIIDSNDKIIVTGTFRGETGYSARLDPDNQSTEYTSINGDDDIFIQKFNSDGSLIWVKSFGGTSWDYPYTLEVNSLNNIFIGGYFDDEIDFDPSIGEDIHTVLPSAGSGYVMQINNQDDYVWTYDFQSDDWAEVASINFTPDGNMYVGGLMYGNTDLDPSTNVDSRTPIGSYDAFIANFSPLVYNNADLSNLETSEGLIIPDFDDETTTYGLVLDNDVTSLSIRPTAEDDNILSIEINGNAVTSGQYSSDFPLNLGNNTFNIVITAGDTTTTKTYTINAWRDNGTNAPYSTDTRLSNLSVSTGTLSPTFVNSTRAYNVDVASNITTYTVTPTLQDSNAYSLKVNGTDVISGNQSQSINLNPGMNSITISVIAEDRRTTGNYIVYVNKDTTPYIPGLKVEWGFDMFGNSQPTYPNEMCVDSLGNSYVIGRFYGSNINLGYPDGNSIHSVASGTDDDYILKYNSEGVFQWARVLSGTLQTVSGGSYDEAINTCTTDSNNNLYVGGYFNGTVDLDMTDGTDNRTDVGASGIGDAFLSKYNADGTYAYSLVFTSTDVNRPEQVRTVVTSDSYVYVAGSMYAGDFDADGTAGVANQPTIGHGDTFISKHTLAGAYIASNRIVGPNYDENPYHIEVDANENIYVAGYWTGASMDFDAGAGTDTKNGNAGTEVFLTKFNNSVAYQWTRTITGVGGEYVRDLELDPTGNIYIVGDAYNSFVIEGGNSFTSPYNGVSDGFVIKYNPSGTVLFNKFITSSNNHEEVNQIKYLNGKFYILGEFNGLLDLDLSTEVFNIDRPNNRTSSFVLIVDEDFDFMNAFAMDNRSVEYADVNGENLYIWGQNSYSNPTYSHTYTPFRLSPVIVNYHNVLIKYKEEAVSKIINLDSNLSFTDDLLGLNLNYLNFLSNDTPTVIIKKNPPLENQNLSYTETSTVYEPLGGFYLSGDDDYDEIELPFTFPFYDSQYNSMLIGTNGMVCFDLTADCDWYPDDGLDDTYYGPFIAPLGFDTETDEDPNHGVFVESTPSKMTIVWKGHEYGEDTVIVEFSLVLYPNGEFEFRYGPQTEDFTYDETYIGVGAGDGVRFTEAPNMTKVNYNYDNTLFWTPAELPVLIADMDVDVSRTRNWINLHADANRSQRKVLTQNVHNAPGSSNVSTYVPYNKNESVSRVIICPNATDLSEITLNCPNGQALRVGKAGVSNYESGGEKYIKLTGYGSFGAMATKSNSVSVFVSDNQIYQGETTTVTVVINDLNGNTDTEYVGTIQIDSNIPGLPTEYTFAPENNGVLVFSNLLLETEGEYTFTAEDSIDEEVLGVSDTIMVLATPIVEPPVEPPVIPPVVPPVIPPVTPPIVEPPIDDEDEEEDTDEETPIDEPPVDPGDDDGDNNGDNTGDDDDNNEKDNDGGIVEGLTNIVTNVIEGFINTISNFSESRIVQEPVQFMKRVPIAIDTTQTITYGSLGLVVTTSLLPATIGASYPIAYFFQFSSMLLAGLKIRKKTRGYGVVYDSVTKEPINRAIVRVFDESGKLASTEVTNVYGAFDVNIPQGNYKMAVQIRTHIYPSNLIQSTSDSPYENIYRGQVFTHNPGEAITFSIPVDPIDKNFVQYASVSFKNKLLSILSYIQYILVLVGFFFVLLNYVKSEKSLDLALLLLYILMMIVNFYIWYKDRKRYGIVIDTEGNTVTGAAIGLREMEFETIYSKRITDEKGRYRFLVPGGKYRIETLDQGISLIPNVKVLYEGKKDKIMTINPNLTLRKTE